MMSELKPNRKDKYNVNFFSTDWSSTEWYYVGKTYDGYLRMEAVKTDSSLGLTKGDIRLIDIPERIKLADRIIEITSKN